jgi:hypothetical protein
MHACSLQDIMSSFSSTGFHWLRGRRVETAISYYHRVETAISYYHRVETAISYYHRVETAMLQTQRSGLMQLSHSASYIRNACMSCRCQLTSSSSSIDYADRAYLARHCNDRLVLLSTSIEVARGPHLLCRTRGQACA